MECPQCGFENEPNKRFRTEWGLAAVQRLKTRRRTAANVIENLYRLSFRAAARSLRVSTMKMMLIM